ncbi:MAG: D-aminoacyl-tRNA deacylase [Flavobacteriales bacterium]
MKAIIQRVKHASVTVDHSLTGKIDLGLLILLGVQEGDSSEDLEWLAGKIAKLRIFSDAEGKMNLALQEVKGRILVVSQFTLLASTKKGNRPSYENSAKPEIAKEMYERFCKRMEVLLNDKVETGIFAADMKVELLNDGPVTIIIDSKNKD